RSSQGHRRRQKHGRCEPDRATGGEARAMCPHRSPPDLTAASTRRTTSLAIALRRRARKSAAIHTSWPSSTGLYPPRTLARASLTETVTNGPRADLVNPSFANSSFSLALGRRHRLRFGGMRISRAMAAIVLLGVLATPVFGVVFSPPRQMDPAPATDDRYDFGGRIAADRVGTWAGVWQSMPANGTAWGPFNDILVSRSVDDGVHWAAPTTIHLGSTHHPIAAPDIATDGAGTWVAVWWTRVGDTGDFDLFFSRSVDNASTWSAPATLNTNAATDTGDDFDPRIATDRAGNWIVTWVSTDSLGGTIGNDNDILASRSTNGGLTWSTPTPVAPSSADGAFDFDPVIATDEA